MTRVGSTSKPLLRCPVKVQYLFLSVFQSNTRKSSTTGWRLPAENIILAPTSDHHTPQGGIYPHWMWHRATPSPPHVSLFFPFLLRRFGVGLRSTRSTFSKVTGFTNRQRVVTSAWWSKGGAGMVFCPVSSNSCSWVCCQVLANWNVWVLMPPTTLSNLMWIWRWTFQHPMFVLFFYFVVGFFWSFKRKCRKGFWTL